MSTNDYKRLNTNVNHIGETLLMSQIETNMKTYLDWGLLEIGGFTNISISPSLASSTQILSSNTNLLTSTFGQLGAYGGTFNKLRLVDDPSYNLGQVWEGARKDWVWETGLTYDHQPINISGVYIDGSFYGTGDVTYSHHYNYPLGRIIFDSAIPTNSNVELNYSYRSVQTYIADQAPWWDEIQYDSYRVDDPTLDSVGSGNWQILANHRVQLPAVIIEAVPRRSFRPYEMGNVSNYVYQDILFHVMAESRWFRNQLLDIISFEKDRTIWLYDNNLVADVTGYPLDYRGMRVGSNMYPDLVDNYRFKKARFYNMTVAEMQSPTSRLHRGVVRATLEIVVA